MVDSVFKQSRVDNQQTLGLLRELGWIRQSNASAVVLANVNLSNQAIRPVTSLENGIADW